MTSESSRGTRSSRRQRMRAKLEGGGSLETIKRNKGKGKERALNNENEGTRSIDSENEDEDEDNFQETSDEDGNENGAGPSDYSSRVKRGWDTRRKQRAETVARQEDLVHPSSTTERYRVDYSSRPSPIRQLTNNDDRPSPNAMTAIPTSALLQSLHQYSTTFYEEHGLLIPPRDRGRSRAWGSKKRIKLLRDATSTTSTTDTLSRLDNSDSDSEGEGEGQRVRVKKEKVVDEHGEIIPDARDRGMDWKDGRKERSKGRYKSRDMRMSIDGSGLMALGILTQEIIIRKLHEAGYRPSQPQPQSQSQSQSHLPTKQSKTKRRKHQEKKSNDLPTSNFVRGQRDDNDNDNDEEGESESTELESEEGNGTDDDEDQ